MKSVVYLGGRGEWRWVGTAAPRTLPLRGSDAPRTPGKVQFGARVRLSALLRYIGLDIHCLPLRLIQCASTQLERFPQLSAFPSPLSSRSTSVLQCPPARASQRETSVLIILHSLTGDAEQNVSGECAHKVRGGSRNGGDQRVPEEQPWNAAQQRPARVDLKLLHIYPSVCC